jgi:hypothetical protein
MKIKKNYFLDEKDTLQNEKNLIKCKMRKTNGGGKMRKSFGIRREKIKKIANRSWEERMVSWLDDKLEEEKWFTNRKKFDKMKNEKIEWR